jgi:hypothetical protein
MVLELNPAGIMAPGDGRIRLMLRLTPLIVKDCWLKEQHEESVQFYLEISKMIMRNLM